MNWFDILTKCGVRRATAERWAPFFVEVIQPDTFSLGLSEVDDFLGQVLHESSMLERMEEGLTYTDPERLRLIWPSRFPTRASALPYVRNPAALAGKVYGGRMGNTSPGDGFKYRGSGPIQVTGRDNFAALELATGLPLLDNPDMLRRPGTEALRVCIAWWEGNVPDSIMGNKARVRRSVNGGIIGLADAERLTGLAGGALA